MARATRVRSMINWGGRNTRQAGKQAGSVLRDADLAEYLEYAVEFRGYGIKSGCTSPSV